VQRAVWERAAAQCLLVGDLIRSNISLATCWPKIAIFAQSDWFLSSVIDWKWAEIFGTGWTSRIFHQFTVSARLSFAAPFLSFLSSLVGCMELKTLYLTANS
jgi:hypothetical protein